jgi:hypothetical protein
MSYSQPQTTIKIGAGIAAGISGSCVLMAARSFDRRYAPKTVPDDRDDPVRFPINGLQNKNTEPEAAVAIHLVLGSLIGFAYSLFRGRSARNSALSDGIAVGMVVYLLGSLGARPALRLTQPVWKQSFPQIAGDLLRHTIFGVATTAAFEILTTLF